MKSYRYDIDGLRAIAVLAVVLFHIMPRKISGGFIGVDIFFVISGFLITQIIWQGLTSNSFSAIEFYAKRIKRLFPALFTMILASSIAVYFIGLPNDIILFAKSALSSTFYISNFYFLSISDYFADDLALNPLLHTWSLSVEEQFYIFLPPILLIIYKISREKLYTSLCMLTLLSLLGCELLLNTNPSAAFFSSPSRFWQFTMGALIAFIPPRFTPDARISSLLGWSSLLVLLICIFEYSEDLPFPGLYAVPPTVASALLILAGSYQNSHLSRFLSLPVMQFFGRISYSLYLWHWPILVFYKMQFSPTLSSIDCLIILVLSIILAYASWRFVETPLRKLNYKTQLKQIYGMAFFMTITTAIITGYFIISSGTASRFSDNAKHFASYLDYDATDAYLKGSCFGEDVSRIDQCIKTSSVKPNILLLGDSHAAQYSSALREIFPEIQFSQATAPGCRPLIPIKKSASCQAVMGRVFETHLKENHFDAIIIAGRWKSSENKKLLTAIKTLEKSTPKIIVLGPIIEYDQALPRILANYSDDTNKIQLINEHNMFRKIEKTDKSLKKILADKPVAYYSVIDTLCSEGICKTRTDNNIPIQFDYGHLTHEGAVQVIKSLISEQNLKFQ